MAAAADADFRRRFSASGVMPRAARRAGPGSPAVSFQSFRSATHPDIPLRLSISAPSTAIRSSSSRSGRWKYHPSGLFCSFAAFSKGSSEGDGLRSFTGTVWVEKRLNASSSSSGDALRVPCVPAVAGAAVTGSNSYSKKAGIGEGLRVGESEGERISERDILVHVSGIERLRSGCWEEVLTAVFL